MNLLESMHITQESDYERLYITIRGNQCSLMATQLSDFVSSIGHEVTWRFDIDGPVIEFSDVDIGFNNKTKMIKKYKKAAMFE